MLILNQTLQTQKLIIKCTKGLHFLPMNLTIILLTIKGPQLRFDRIQVDLLKLINFLILLNQRGTLIEPYPKIPSIIRVIFDTKIVLSWKRVLNASNTIMVTLRIIIAELLSIRQMPCVIRRFVFSHVNYNEIKSRQKEQKEAPKGKSVWEVWRGFL